MVFQILWASGLPCIVTECIKPNATSKAGCWGLKHLFKITEVHQLSKHLKHYVRTLKDWPRFWKIIVGRLLSFLGIHLLSGPMSVSRRAHIIPSKRARPVTWKVPTNSPLVQGWAYPFPGHGHSGHRNPGPMYRDHPTGPLRQYGPAKLKSWWNLIKVSSKTHTSFLHILVIYTWFNKRMQQKNLRNYHIILHHLQLPHFEATILENT